MKANKFQKISYVLIAAAALAAGAANAAGAPPNEASKRLQVPRRDAANEIRVPGLTINGQPNRSFAERFKLYREPGFVPNANCDMHTALDLDVAELNGKIAILEERVAGICEIYAVPNTRVYRLSREDAGCGSSLYKGTLQTNEGVSEVEILDHRNRRCRDRVEARVIVTEKKNGAENVLYSSQLVVRQIEDAPVTCMAYWEGYVRENGACVQRGASGCQSPFEFETQAACEAATQPR